MIQEQTFEEIGSVLFVFGQKQVGIYAPLQGDRRAEDLYKLHAMVELPELEQDEHLSCALRTY